MIELTVEKLLEANVHFGHLSKFYNPKNFCFIAFTYNQVSVFNLNITLECLKIASEYILSSVAAGKTILFVGTKKVAKDFIEKFAERCGMPYVNFKWLGGMLTNYQTIKQSVQRLHRLQQFSNDGTLMKLTKKEGLDLLHELEYLNLYFCGIKNMKKLPDILVVMDVNKESIAVREAKKLGISVVGVVDSDSSIDGIDYVIPGNDDSIKSIELYLRILSDSVLKGVEKLKKN